MFDCFLWQLAVVGAHVALLSAAFLWRLGRGWAYRRRNVVLYYTLGIPVALIVMYYPPCEWFG